MDSSMTHNLVFVFSVIFRKINKNWKEQKSQRNKCPVIYTSNPHNQESSVLKKTGVA